MRTDTMGLETAASQESKEHDMYIVFRIKETLFAVNGSDVLSIQQFPEKLLNIPHAPAYLRGTHKSQGSIFSVVDLRKFFHWTTIQQEYEKFVQMIDQRKQDHINWVETLRRSYRTGEVFHLAKDCHQCALGRWRDEYKTDALSIQRLLQDLDVPHSRLHALADQILGNQEMGNDLLEEVDQKLVPDVLKILDTMKHDFRNREFREMLLILRNESCVALTVDEILGVETLGEQWFERITLGGYEKNYIHGVRQRVATEELVMELDVPAFISCLNLEE